MKKLIFISTLFFLFLFGHGCFKPDTQVGYYVYLTKKVDSLPCEAEVSYPDMGKMKTASVGEDWSFSQKVHYDQAVTLKATALNNIESLKVEIYAKESSVSESCAGSCTSVMVSKNLYE